MADHFVPADKSVFEQSFDGLQGPGSVVRAALIDGRSVAFRCQENIRLPNGSIKPFSGWVEIARHDLEAFAHGPAANLMNRKVEISISSIELGGETLKYVHEKRLVVRIDQVFVAGEGYRRFGVKREHSESSVVAAATKFLNGKPISDKRALVHRGKWNIAQISSKLIESREELLEYGVGHLGDGRIQNILACHRDRLPEPPCDQK